MERDIQPATLAAGRGLDGRAGLAAVPALHGPFSTCRAAPDPELPVSESDARTSTRSALDRNGPAVEPEVIRQFEPESRPLASRDAAFDPVAVPFHQLVDPGGSDPPGRDELDRPVGVDEQPHPPRTTRHADPHANGLVQHGRILPTPPEVYDRVATGSTRSKAIRTEGGDWMSVDIWTYRNDSALGVDVGRGVDLSGFAVEALDGSIGTIDEATYDVGSSYIVVDTGPWIFGKKVMLPAGVIDRIDLDDETVWANRSKDEIKAAPEYDETVHADDRYREELSSYYGLPRP